MHFQLSDELGKQVERAAETLKMTPAEWISKLVAAELQPTPNPSWESYVRGTTKPGGRPAQYVKPDAEYRSTIEQAREKLRQIQQASSQPCGYSYAATPVLPDTPPARQAWIE